MLDVDRLQAEVGATVEMADVLLLGENGDIAVGAPTVEGARVVAEVVEHLRGDKIRIFKYKNKVRYRRRQGHRQNYTRLVIREIVTPTGEAAPAAPAGSAPIEEKPRRAPRARARPAADAAAPAEAPTEQPEVEAAAVPEAVAESKPRRTRTAPDQTEAAAEEAPAKPAGRARKTETPEDGE